MPADSIGNDLSAIRAGKVKRGLKIPFHSEREIKLLRTTAREELNRIGQEERSGQGQSEWEAAAQQCMQARRCKKLKTGEAAASIVHTWVHSRLGVTNSVFQKIHERKYSTKIFNQLFNFLPSVKFENYS
eukprot:scpid49160/ scgid31147/ 